MSSEIWVPYRFNTWNLRTSVCLLVIWTLMGVGRWHLWFTLTLWPFRGQPRLSEVNDLCAPRGNLVGWFWIWHPFAIHMCRNRVIGAIKYQKEKCLFLRFFSFWPQKRAVGDRNASHSSPMTVRNVLVSALACSDTKLSANSHFGHFWVIDLTSEVTGWPRALNSGVNGFVSWQATHCFFFNRSSNSLRSQTRGWSYPREGWRNSECHFLQTKVANLLYANYNRKKEDRWAGKRSKKRKGECLMSASVVS